MRAPWVESTGSLGIAISEAVEVAVKKETAIPRRAAAIHSEQRPSVDVVDVDMIGIQHRPVDAQTDGNVGAILGGIEGDVSFSCHAVERPPIGSIGGISCIGSSSKASVKASKIEATSPIDIQNPDVGTAVQLGFPSSIATPTVDARDGSAVATTKGKRESRQQEGETPRDTKGRLEHETQSNPFGSRRGVQPCWTRSSRLLAPIFTCAPPIAMTRIFMAPVRRRGQACLRREDT